MQCSVFISLYKISNMLWQDILPGDQLLKIYPKTAGDSYGISCCSHNILFILIFFYMLSALINNGAYMLICQRIENGFSLSAAFHQLILLQDTKLV